MDILVSSNLERLLFFLSEGDSKYIKKIMKDLYKYGEYNVTEEIKDKMDTLFWSDYSTENETLESIKKIYSEKEYLIDTHTAVALNVYDKYKTETGDSTTSIILSTASPFKFIESIYDALGIEEEKEGKELVLDFSERFNIEIPVGLKELINKSYIHNKVIKIEDVKNEIYNITDKRG